MRNHRRLGVAKIMAGAALFAVFACATSRGQQTAPQAGQDIPSSQTIQPEDLAKAITASDKPIVVCVAPHFLYEGAHIPGALYHGPGSTPDGIKDLRQWAQGVPKDSKIVIYCGCCPISRCPNVRPAFAALHEMGFSNVKVLWLPKDFHTDWIEKGYPVEKGQ